MSPFLTETEVREMCPGLKRPRAIYRWIVEQYRMKPIGVMPNGLPLLARTTEPKQGFDTEASPNVVAFRAKLAQK